MTAKDKAAAALLTLFVWGLAGALFGGLFAGIHQVLVVMGLAGWQPLIIGAAAVSTRHATCCTHHGSLYPKILFDALLLCDWQHPPSVVQ